ncbi:related to cytochrome-c mitochondrial import factor CYC2 [Phialocephala subalpina]|uniref:Related to cytochrome-c mitochondrial import factor CYC2 n=1 Tax=Phialocephala subalpina TaxID=576137 RepID=A0A1L7X5B2_9HELO|nr:related to cytochrome-c mitochondrial import factor CYC2 [Phialocephala subalpina]
MRPSTRALRFAPRQCLFAIPTRSIRTPWRLPTTPRKLAALNFRPFSSTALSASFQNRRAEEIERLANETEEEILRKRARRSKRLYYGWLAVFFPATIWCFWYNTKEDESMWREKVYTPFTIMKRENVSSTAFILTIRPRLGQHQLGVNTDPYAEYWDQGTWAVKIAQPELQIARYYTPLPPLDSDKPHELRFLIRKIEDGEVSVYLDRIPVGGTVFLNGPRGMIGLQDVEDGDDILFLAGGTGIAPAIGLAYSLLERRKYEAGGPKLRILWANRRREDCLGGDSSNILAPMEATRMNRIVKELEDLQRKHSDRFFVDYFVDEEGTAIDEGKVLQVTKSMSGPSGKMLMVSGPEGFVDYFAGPKKWEDGQEKQGTVGGLLGRLRLNLDGWEVVKL